MEPGTPLKNTMHEKFCQAYVEQGYNGAEAAKKAGYKRDHYNRACMLLKESHMKARIKEISEEVLYKYKNTLEYRIIDRAIAIAFATPEDYITPEGKKRFKEWSEVDPRPVKSIRLISKKDTPDTWELQLHDPKPYLDILITYIGLANQNININNNNDIKTIPDDRLDDEIKKYEKIIKGSLEGKK
jgi:hypothetical protein